MAFDFQTSERSFNTATRDHDACTKLIALLEVRLKWNKALLLLLSSLLAGFVFNIWPGLLHWLWMPITAWLITEVFQRRLLRFELFTAKLLQRQHEESQAACPKTSREDLSSELLFQA